MQTAAAASRALSFEAGAALLCYELYPLGMLGRPIPYLPLGRGGAGHRPPLLFIHGVLHNGSAFTWMKQRLALAGWNTFHEIKLATTRDTVPAMASRTADCIERLMARHRCSQVDVVAHSLGGLVARYYLQFLGGDGRVRNLITLGTPHRGTYWSRLSPWPHLKDLHPESPLMKRLNRLPVPHRTRIVAVSGARDVLMRPRDCGWWEGVRNISLNNVGHSGLLYSGRALRIITAHLREPCGDPENPDLCAALPGV